jgi:uncharacterized protein
MTLNPSAENSLSRWIKAHDLLAFFILTFLFTFGGWFAALISGVAGLFDFGLWGPALAALLTVAVTRGRPGLKELFRRLLLWRVPARWYLLILIGWPLISILAALLHARITNQPVTFEWDQWSGFLAWLYAAPLLGFWACEEIGWRGFALPRLLARWNALTSSIILGVVWWFWHLPYFVGMEGVSAGFYPFLVFTVSLSILMTWIFNHTRGSIFVATFFHFWINIYDGLQADKIPLAGAGGEAMIKYWLLAGAAVLVVLLYGYRSFTRDRGSSAPVELKTFEV